MRRKKAVTTAALFNTRQFTCTCQMLGHQIPLLIERAVKHAGFTPLDWPSATADHIRLDRALAWSRANGLDFIPKLSPGPRPAATRPSKSHGSDVG
jgi:hypothetical protein